MMFHSDQSVSIVLGESVNKVGTVGALIGNMALSVASRPGTVSL